MNDMTDNYFTFAFNIDPDLNDGYTEAFKQGDETWWWYTKGDEGPAAGPVPNFTGATVVRYQTLPEQLSSRFINEIINCFRSSTE